MLALVGIIHTAAAPGLPSTIDKTARVDLLRFHTECGSQAHLIFAGDISG
jgi:hypothetical protein